MADFRLARGGQTPGCRATSTGQPSCEESPQGLEERLGHGISVDRFDWATKGRRHLQQIGQTGLKQSTDSWYTGANIEGKPRVFMPYLGGCPAYAQKCEDVVAKGYEGFAFE